MTALSYTELALEWRPKSKRDHTFNLIAVILIAFFLLFAILISLVDVPKEERRVRVIPERVAKFIQQREKPKIKKPEPKPEFKKILRKKKVEKKPLDDKEKKARKKAEKSGLLALGKDLADLMDTRAVNSMVGRKITSSANKTQVATVDTKLLTAGAGKGSGGVQAENYITHTQPKTVLSQRERDAVRKTIIDNKNNLNGVKTDTSTGTQRRGDNVRSEEDIRYVLDKNKGTLHTLYRQARRKNAGLKGKIIILITILPSGEVEDARISSSELNDSRLEKRILARIRQFNFGQSNVEKVTITFPIEFLPS